MEASSAQARPRTQNDWLVGKRVGRYDILLRLAAGGMGAVYVGRAVALGGFERLVAIKILHPHLADEEEFITMLLDEARLAARVRHPNVVATVDVAQWDDLHYLVMDYVEGDHLAGLMRDATLLGKPLARRPVIRIALDALAGLGAAHELTDDRGNLLNLVHRDVSPQNILVGSDGIARLTDFGVAKAEYRLSSTRQGTFKGKLAYTAPETASTAHAEQRSDLFAMGVVLWEALTTKRLFRAESNVATLKMLLEDPIPAPSSVDPALAPFDAVLAKALARPLDERYQSAHEMMDALEKAAQAAEGTGTTREVAELVRELSAAKLKAERDGIREAIETLGNQPTAAYVGGSARDGLEVDIAVSESQPPTAYEGIPDARKKRAIMVVAVFLLIFVVAVVGALVATDQGGEEPVGDVPSDTSVTSPETPRTAEEVEDEGSTAGGTDEGTGETTLEAAMVPEPTMEPETAMETARTAEDEVATEEADVATPSAMMRVRNMRQRQQGGGEDEDVLSNPYRQQ